LRIKNKLKGIVPLWLLRLELFLAAIISVVFGYFLDYLNVEGYSIESGFYAATLFIGITTITFLFNLSNHFIRYLATALYLGVMCVIIYKSTQYDFSLAHFFTLVLVYTFISYTQNRVKFYLLYNAVIIGIAVLAYLVNPNFPSKEGLIYFLTFILIFLIGLVSTYSRAFSKSRLSSRKNLLDYIFNHVSDGLILVNKNNHQIVECNQIALKILDLKRVDTIGKKIEEIKVDDQKVFEEKLIEDQLHTVKLRQVELINFSVKGIAFFNEAYYLIDLRSYQSQQEFQLSKEYQSLLANIKDNYRYLFNESSSLICVFDQSGYILDVNETLTQKLGYTKEEMLGKKYDFIDAEDYFDREEQNRQALGGINQKIEKKVLHKDGHIIDLELIIRKAKYFGEEVLISNGRDISARKKLEKEVDYHLKSYKRVYKNSPNGIAVADINGNILNCNSAFSMLLGYTEEEFLKLNVKDITHPDDYQTTLIERKKLIEREIKIMNLQKRFLHKSGRTVEAILKTVLIDNEEGKQANLLTQIVDISEIKEAQKRLEISEKSYRDLFNASHDLLYILNDQNEFLDFNNSVLEKYGYEKEEIIGKTPEIFSAPDLNDIDNVNQIIKKAWEGKEQNLLWWSIKKDGSIFPKELNLKKVTYKQKEVLLASGRDISQAYNYEKKLKQKEIRYRQLFERNLAGIYRTSKEGVILECNLSFANIIGYSKPEDLIEKLNVNDLYVEKRVREKLLRDLSKSKLVRGKKVTLINTKGNQITVLLNVSSIYDEQGKFNYYEGSIIDITDLDRAQNLLLESQKKYQSLIDESPFGILIIHENKVLFSNSEAIKILQAENALQLEGKALDYFLNGKTLNQLLELLKHKNYYETKAKDLKQNTIQLELKASPIHFEDKDCHLLSIVDITEKKKIEKENKRIKGVETFNKILQAELEEREKIQENLVNAKSYTEGIIESSLDMIFTANHDGKINRLNSAAKLEFKAYNKLVGESLKVIFSKESEANNVLNSLNEKKSFTGEVTLKRTDGSLFPAYLSLSYLYNTDDVVMGIMGVSRNITDLKKKELEIKNQAAKLSSIIETSSHFFFTIDRNYYFTSFNQGFKHDVFENSGQKIKIGTHFYEIIPQDLEQNRVKEFWNDKFSAVFNKEAVHFEIERSSEEGVKYFREIYLNPIYNENGAVIEVSGIAHDITDNKIAEENLKNSLNEKEVLLQEVHHRVKNNMQVINSILSLQSVYTKDDSVLKILRESQNRIKSMSYIHEKLYQTKDFSKINFGDYLVELSQNLLRSYENPFHQVRLITECDEVNLNLDQAIPCGLIVNELISNSLKYAFTDDSSDCKLFVGVKAKGSEVTLTVEDNGIGIQNIDIANLESLGLQLVNTLTEQLEGRLDLEVSLGTKFNIIFESREEVG
jgi:PAS domain S-box-containing protein